MRLDPRNHIVTVGPRTALLRSQCRLQDVNFIRGPINNRKMNVQVKMRSRHEPVDAVIESNSLGGAVVSFAEPCDSVAPGQACVFYRGTEVLGGGWVMRDPDD